MIEESPSMSCPTVSSGSLSPDPGLLAERLVVEVNIQDDRWLDCIAALEALAGEASREAFLGGYGPLDSGVATAEIALTFADDKFVQGLNAQHRALDKTTNVLSFATVSAEELEQFCAAGSGQDGSERELLLGDVVLAFETISQEAKDQGKRLSDHTVHLVVHGVLHLLGFDHDQDAKAARMEGLEADILENLGIGNPYLVTAEEARQ